MSDPLLRIRNHHSLSCGDPPIVNSDNPSVYIGYFENVHSEQWIFTYSRSSKVGILRGGDLGWNKAIAVVDGTAPGVVLSTAEQAWLATCWMAATGPMVQSS